MINGVWGPGLMEKDSMIQLEQELDALARYIQRVRQ
ncbi:MAG: hypothetical protein ACI82H_001221 [Alphaproteobacteria bacterium]|jgi:hypothetical protein